MFRVSEGLWEKRKKKSNLLSKQHTFLRKYIYRKQRMIEYLKAIRNNQNQEQKNLGTSLSKIPFLQEFS